MEKCRQKSRVSDFSFLYALSAQRRAYAICHYCKKLLNTSLYNQVIDKKECVHVLLLSPISPLQKWVERKHPPLPPLCKKRANLRSKQ